MSASNVTQLLPQSEEYAQVQHLLRLCLRSTDVKELTIWSVGNPHLNVQFERRMGSKLVLDSWVDVSKLDLAQNPVQDLCARGYKMPSDGNGATFTVGNIAFEPESAETRRLLLCRIGVGRSFVLDDAAAERLIPDGYDSLYVHNPVDVDGDGKISADEFDVAASLGGRPAGEYSHKYVLTDSSQVLPAYLVQFKFNAVAAGSDKICDSCETELATVYCAADDAHLCTDCDTSTHSHNKLVSRHVRVPLAGGGGKYRSSLTDAKSRVGDALALLGPSAVDTTHKLIADMSEEYERCLREGSEADPTLEERKRGLQDALAAIEERAHAVQDNSVAVEEAIYQKMQELLGQLQDETARKITGLLAEELELRRQLEELQWAEQFVPVMQETLPPVSFIPAWRQHRSLLSQVQLSQPSVTPVNCRALNEVFPDLELSGHYSVVCGRSGREGPGKLSSAGVSFPQAMDASARMLRNAGTAVSTSGTSGYLESTKGGYTVGYGSLGPAPQLALTSGGPEGVSSPSSNLDINSMWSSQLKEQLKVTNTAAPVTSGYTGAMHPGMLDEQQVQAALALARAKDAVLAAAMQSYPVHLQAHAEAARSEAKEELQRAEAMHAAFMLSRQGAQGDLFQSHAAPTAVVKPYSGESKHDDTISVAPTATQTVRSKAGRDYDSNTPALSRRPESTVTAGYQPPVSLGAGKPTGSVSVPAAVAPPPPPPTSGATLAARLQQKIKQFSLKAEADRRLKRQPGLAIVSSAAKFVDSKIVMGEAAAVLYACLPVTVNAGGTSSSMHMLYRSTDYATPNIRDFVDRFKDVALPGTVILVKSGPFVFGGYAAESWIFDGQYGGNPRSFLFSITHDCKIPYHGRVKGPEQASDADTAQQFEEHQKAAYTAALGYNPFTDFAGRPEYAHLIPKLRPWVRHDCMRADADYIQFGTKDLLLSGDLSECSSQLEFSYGIGIAPDSIDAKTFLAGKPVFRADVVEVWAIGEPGQGDGGVPGDTGSVAASAGPGDSASTGQPPVEKLSLSGFSDVRPGVY